MKMVINTGHDIYIEDGKIVSAVTTDEDTIISKQKATIKECLIDYINWHIIPSDPPAISTSDRDAIVDMMSDFIKQISRASDYLNSFHVKENPQVEMIFEPKTVSVYRYIRRPNNAMYNNLGGVSFLFEFDNGVNRDELRFSYAICSPEDNFCTELGRAMVENRMEEGQYTSIPYDRSISLTENVFSYLTEKYLANELEYSFVGDEKKLYKAMSSFCMDY